MTHVTSLEFEGFFDLQKSVQLTVFESTSCLLAESRTGYIVILVGTGTLIGLKNMFQNLKVL